MGAEGGVGVLPIIPPLGLLESSSEPSELLASSLSFSWCVGRWFCSGRGGKGALPLPLELRGGPVPFDTALPGSGRI